MGGALNYRDPDRAEHNFRRDPAAVATVLALATADATVALDEIGRMRFEPDGTPVRLSARVDYDGFLRWLDRWAGP